MESSYFDELKEQYVLDIKAVVEMEKVPSEIVFNWDYTGINIVPGSQWTMERKDSKRVELTGLNDKCQITAAFCVSLTGEFLSVQLIYQDKTTANLPRYAFPDDWDNTFTPNHWSNEDKTKEYINNIIIFYVQRKREDLKLSPSQSALAIYDEFKGQLTPDIFSLLEASHIFVIKVPPYCTNHLQPMDLSVSCEGIFNEKFQHWYSGEMQSLATPMEASFLWI